MRHDPSQGDAMPSTLPRTFAQLGVSERTNEALRVRDLRQHNDDEGSQKRRNARLHGFGPMNKGLIPC